MTEHVRDICKIGQGAACCKYLSMGGNGWECMKANLATKIMIDENWAHNAHVSQGDNCDGLKTFEKLNAPK